MIYVRPPTNPIDAEYPSQKIPGKDSWVVFEQFVSGAVTYRQIAERYGTYQVTAQKRIQRVWHEVDYQIYLSTKHIRERKLAASLRHSRWRVVQMRPDPMVGD